MSKDIFVLWFYAQICAIIATIIYIAIRYLRKKWFVFSSDVLIECKLKRWISKYDTVISISFNVMLAFVCTVVFFHSVIPAIHDIPYVLNNEFVFLEGVVTNNSQPGSKGKMEKHNLFIYEEDSGEVLNLQIYGRSEIKSGTIVCVEYLPNSKEGILLSRYTSD